MNNSLTPVEALQAEIDRVRADIANPGGVTDYEVRDMRLLGAALEFAKAEAEYNESGTITQRHFKLWDALELARTNLYEAMKS